MSNTGCCSHGDRRSVSRSDEGAVAVQQNPVSLDVTPTVSRMRDLLDQIYAATNAGQFYLCLFPSLTLPDICAAMESDDGMASRSRYVAWFDKYVAHKYYHSVMEECVFSGDDCYYYRCALLHQGTGQHPKLRWNRVFFLEPGSGPVANMNVIGDMLNLDVGLFCINMLNSVLDWWSANSETENVKRNWDRFLQRYPSGFPPFASVPTIT